MFATARPKPVTSRVHLRKKLEESKGRRGLLPLDLELESRPGRSGGTWTDPVLFLHEVGPERVGWGWVVLV
eukprot:753880-Hanusia_phi.AAC.3